MTNVERIKSMSFEDMEDTINQIAEMGEYMGEYIPFCKNLEECNDIAANPYTSGKCKECVRDWLMAEAKG